MKRSAAVLVCLAILAGQIAATTAQEFSSVRHEATVRLDPGTRTLDVADRITVAGRRDILFLVAPWLRATSVRLDGATMPLPPDGELRRLRLPDTGRHVLDIRLRGTAPELEPGRNRRQAAAFGAEGGYLFNGSGWLPEIGWARSSYRVTVEVPSDQRVVVTGRLEGETAGSDGYRATFVTENSVEPPSLFAGPYVIKERMSGDIRIRTYFYRDQANLADGYLADSARYIERYAKLIGAYPYRDFHVIAAPIPVGLGFPNLTYIGRRILPLPFLRARSLAHEVLHNWWGNGVAFDSASGNWAEGLTTYMADYALAAEKDPARGREMRLAWLRDFAALPTDRDTPVTRFRGKHSAAAQVVGYNKVAFIFHMLKAEIGETAFNSGLRAFWQSNRNRTAGWEQLRQAFQSAAGRDLTSFFDQWLNRSGAPSLTLRDAAVEGADNSYRVRFTLRQDAPEWRLTLPVSVRTAGGVVKKDVVLSEKEQQLFLEVAGRPLALEIDPEWNVFRRLLPGETPPILRDVTLASDTVTIISAGDAAMADAARTLAGRLLDTRMTERTADKVRPETAPVLIVGGTKEISATLGRLGLGSVPARLAGRGTARVWTVSSPGRRPALVIAADDLAALTALLRPLPHYGSRSYLVFDGRRAIDRGVWQAVRSPLSKIFTK